MDEESKTRFKWTFYRLTVQLNIIILLVAVAIIGIFLVPEPYRLPLVIGMLLFAGVLSWNFLKKYRETKAWLEVHAGKGKSE